MMRKCKVSVVISIDFFQKTSEMIGKMFIRSVLLCY